MVDRVLPGSGLIDGNISGLPAIATATTNSYGDPNPFYMANQSSIRTKSDGSYNEAYWGNFTAEELAALGFGSGGTVANINIIGNMSVMADDIGNVNMSAVNVTIVDDVLSDIAFFSVIIVELWNSEDLLHLK